MKKFFIPLEIILCCYAAWVITWNNLRGNLNTPQEFLMGFLLLFFLLVLPLGADSRSFYVVPPAREEIIQAILKASQKTKIRAALLHGILAQETGYGKNLGKTEGEWSSFCANRNTQDCKNWKRYDCKEDYQNARHYDGILQALGFVDSRGESNRNGIPTSSTCALGFTQFEPATWWLLTQGLKDKIYDPWDIQDSILVTAYYLEGLGADSGEILGPDEILGSRDIRALQKYYCGGSFLRLECVEYANAVLNKARHSFEILLKIDLQRQLEILRKKKSESAEISLSQCFVSPTEDFSFGVIPNAERTGSAVKLLEALNRDLVEKLKSYQKTPDDILVADIQKIVQKRKDYLVEAIYRNPNAAIFYLLLENDRKVLARLTENCSETETVLEGRLEVLQVDFEDGSAETQYTLVLSDGRRITLHPALGIRTSLESGMLVKIKGVKIDNELIFNGSHSLEESQDFSGGINVIQ